MLSTTPGEANAGAAPFAATGICPVMLLKILPKLEVVLQKASAFCVPEPTDGVAQLLLPDDNPWEN